MGINYKTNKMENEKQNGNLAKPMLPAGRIISTEFN